MKRILPFLFAVLLFVSCSDRPHDDSLVKVALSSEMPTLDIMVNTSLVGRIVLLNNVYERLFSLDEEGNVEPQLAESYRVESDGKRLYIKLREGVHFHDGSLLDADDALSSLNRWLDSYKSASDSVGGSRFKREGDYEISIESSENLHLFPYLISSSPQSAIITTAESIENEVMGLLTSPIGTGPFALESYTKGEKIVLRRNQSYWNSDSTKEPAIERVEFYFVDDALTRRLGLESGEYDFINDVMSYDIPSFEENDDIALYGGSETGSIALVFNKRSDLGSDEDFRKGVSLSLDFDSLMKSCYGDSGYTVDTNYMDSTESAFHIEDENPYKGLDINRAREYIKKSSYSGEPFRILTSNLSNLDKIAVYIKDALESVNVDSEIILLDWAGMLEARKDETLWDIYISAFNSVPLPTLKSYLMKDFPGWISDEDASSVSRILSSESLDEASAIWRDVQKELWEKVLVIVPGHYMTTYAASSSLQGVNVERGLFSFEDASYKK